MQFRFGDHLLDVERRELSCGGQPVSLEPQVFDLLLCLIRNRDKVLTRDDLLATIWGGRIVSDSTITSRINAARRALGDSGEAQRLIRTVQRKGIRFVGEIADDVAAPEAPPQDRPSIAVLRGSMSLICIAASLMIPATASPIPQVCASSRGKTCRPP